MLNLLWVIAVIFVVMWALGFAFHFTLGGFIHVLLALAIIGARSGHPGPSGNLIAGGAASDWPRGLPGA